MHPRVSPVSADFKSDNLSKHSPISARLVLLVFLVAGGSVSRSVSGQQQQPPSGAGQNQDSATKQNSESSTETPRSDRQLQIAQQSAGLLQMAKDLKTELDTTSSDTLSVAAFRKADAIERFTQNVKDQNKHPNRKP